MDFGKLGELSIGLAMGLGALWLTLQIIKAAKRNGNGKSPEKAGEKSPEYWQLKMEDITQKAIERAFVTRNAELRRMMQEVIGEWMDRRFPPGH